MIYKVCRNLKCNSFGLLRAFSLERMGKSTDRDGIFWVIAKIVRDFNNEQIKKMFGKQVNAMEENKFNRLRGSREERAALATKMDQWREQNSQVQKNLDQTVESLEDRFADLVNIVEYDAKRLESEHLGGKSIGSKEKDLPCLKVRTDVAACLAEGKDIRACEPFVQALEDCATSTITNKVA